MNRLLLPLALVTLLPLLIQADNFGCKSYLRFGAITKNSVVTCPKDNCAHLEGTTSIGLKFEAGGCDIGNFCNGQGKIQEQTFTRDEWNRKFPENGLPEFIQDVKVSGSCCYQECGRFPYILTRHCHPRLARHFLVPFPIFPPMKPLVLLVLIPLALAATPFCMNWIQFFPGTRSIPFRENCPKGICRTLRANGDNTYVASGECDHGRLCSKVQAVRERTMTRAELEKAIGKRLPFPEVAGYSKYKVEGRCFRASISN